MCLFFVAEAVKTALSTKLLIFPEIYQLRIIAIMLTI